jgi:hypothetical protein
VLFTLRTIASGWDQAQIVVQSLETGERRVLVDGGADARYVPTGHLAYVVAGTLLAVPFDLERLEVLGGPVPVVEGVRPASVRGAAQFSLSDNGSLVFLTGSVPADGSGDARQLTQGAYHVPTSVSPDGKSLILRQSVEGGSRDIAILRLEDDREPEAILATPFDEHNGMISPDGHWLAYVSNESGRNEVYVRPFPDLGTKWPISTEGGASPCGLLKGGSSFIATATK